MVSPKSFFKDIVSPALFKTEEEVAKTKPNDKALCVEIFILLPAKSKSWY